MKECLNQLRQGNLVWYTATKDPMVNALNAEDLYNMYDVEYYPDLHKPIKLTSAMFKNALNMEVRKKKENIEIRKASLQDGFVFCYRGTPIRFIRFLHEYQNLYLDIKGRLPEIINKNITYQKQ